MPTLTSHPLNNLKRLASLAACFASILLLLVCSAVAQTTWRSSLYPENWKPGFEDAQGNYLHDFSYAGYHRGEIPIPDYKDAVLIDVTAEPYRADNTGAMDSTTAIQSALDAAAAKGGGVVFLPAGTYKVAPAGNAMSALTVWGDKVVLRGAGADKSFIYNDSVSMRGKSVITVAPKKALLWMSNGMPKVAVTADVLKPTVIVPVQDTSALTVGSYVVIRSDITQRMIDQLGMTGVWKPGSGYLPGLCYARRIVAVDAGASTITVDVPLRGFLYAADNARVSIMKNLAPVGESGVEDFSIGMKQHPGDGLDDNDKKNMTQGTTAYELHRAAALTFDSAEHCWARRINSYCPPGNAENVHLLSHGVRLTRSRNVTVEKCEFSHPQYKGEGGNGYMYTLYSNDCLLKDCTGRSGRHNFSFGEMSANGNVIYNFHTIDGRLPSDFHMFFSLVNLIDNAKCEGDYIAAAKRTYGTHGETTTQSVLWNTQGLRYPIAVGEYGGHPTRNPQIIILSQQWDKGYVVGTSGPCADIDCNDFVEGKRKGDSLSPQSLYLDQLERRKANK